jgi:hypothetical protein
MDPKGYDPKFQRKRSDEMWEAFVFTTEELHTAIYTLDFQAEILTVYVVVVAFFENGFTLRL